MQLSFFQSDHWANIQSKWTWKPIDIGGLLAFEKYTTGTRKYIFLQDLTVEFDELAQIKAQISRFLENERYDFARLEINNPVTLSYLTTLDGLRFVAINKDLPVLRQSIPLNISGEDFFDQMDAKTRTLVHQGLSSEFSILLSEDVNKVAQDVETLSNLLNLGQLNISRVDLNQDYLKDLLSYLYQNKVGFCVIIKHKGYVIGQMVFVLINGQSELILASLNEYQDWQSEYRFALWQAMMELQNRQSQICIIQIDQAQLKSEVNLSFVKEFMMACGGQNYEMVGTYDLPLNNVAYKQYSLSQGINNFKFKVQPTSLGSAGQEIQNGVKSSVKSLVKVFDRFRNN